MITVGLLRKIPDSPSPNVQFTRFIVERTIMDNLLFAFSMSDYLFDSWHELFHYGSHLTQTHWAILAVATCATGFVCLLGNSLRP